MKTLRMQNRLSLAIATCAFAVLASSCASVPNPAPEPPPAVSPTPQPPSAAPQAAPAPGEIATPPVEPAPVLAPAPPAQVPPSPTSNAILQQVDWNAMPDWAVDNQAEAIAPLLLSCTALRLQAEWRPACAAAAQVRRNDEAAAQRFFETEFQPYAVSAAGNGPEGLVTGYYEPLLSGSRTPDKVYRYPVYGVPDDLLSIDLGNQYPALKGMRVRGRLQGRKVVPYYTRAEIDRGDAAVRGRELLWVDDAVELFFLQVQGSGRVRLPNGEVVRLGYAEHNGHPYRSIGRVLIERGELAADKASMQGIKQWASKNPDMLALLLQQNPAYVFFRELPSHEAGPIGTLGVALTPGRSIAVDPAALPLGAPVFLAATWPLSSRPLNRLVLAQDTGSAIKGAVRADFFWGFGDEAGALAGRMRQGARMWLLYPKGFTPPQSR
jgi:membrane-bound lytic murein transglycosylase A